MMRDYDIISSGSDGNAVVVDKSILIDCGVSFSRLTRYVKSLRLVLLTHIHSDHFNKRTVKKLAKERPTLRFGCGEWLVGSLVDCGVRAQNIDVLRDECKYNYGAFEVVPVPLVHNVPNCGYKIHFPDWRMIYATDTNNLNGIEAKAYDLYLIEANYSEEEIEARIKEKREKSIYSYEMQVIHNHLARSKCDDFIYKNIGACGEYVYMHEHKERKV